MRSCAAATSDDATSFGNSAAIQQSKARQKSNLIEDTSKYDDKADYLAKLHEGTRHL